ncbi:MAG: nucleoside triphosphate pyrophosphatase [bacterium]
MLPDKVFLASKSPRRLDLLSSAFKNVKQINSLLEEPKWQKNQNPAQYLKECIGIKALGARQAYELYQEKIENKNTWALIVAADTVVVRGEILYGKPEGPKGAVKMLSELMGKEHQVQTAYYVGLYQGGVLEDEFQDLISTKVRFRKASAQEILAYVKTGEPLDKSGSYGVQGPALQFVEKVDGSYASVMGLPVFEIHKQVLLWQKKFLGDKV